MVIFEIYFKKCFSGNVSPRGCVFVFGTFAAITWEK